MVFHYRYYELDPRIFWSELLGIFHAFIMRAEWFRKIKMVRNHRRWLCLRSPTAYKHSWQQGVVISGHSVVGFPTREMSRGCIRVFYPFFKSNLRRQKRKGGWFRKFGIQFSFRFLSKIDRINLVCNQVFIIKPILIVLRKGCAYFFRSRESPDFFA